MFGTVTGWSPTRSCTATPTSRSSTARATPRSWRRKPPGSGWPPSRSPTTTASTASVRFAVAARDARAAHGLRRRADARDRTRPPNGMPDPEGEHLVVLAEGPAGLRPARPGDQRGAAARGRRARRAPPRRARRRRPRAGAPRPAAERGQRLAGSCSPAVARARCPPRSCATVPRPRGARSTSSSTRSAATACSWSCGTTAIRSTGTATTRSRRSRRAPASRWSPPTTCTTPRPRSVRSPPRSRRCAPRRSLDEIDGWLPAAPFAHLRSAAEQARRFARWPGAVERTVEIARACAFDLQPRRARAARPRRARRPHRDDVAARAHRARRGACATRRRIRSTSRRCARSRTSST